MSSNTKISKVVKTNKPTNPRQDFIIISKLREIELIYKLGGELSKAENKKILKVIQSIFKPQKPSKPSQKLRL